MSAGWAKAERVYKDTLAAGGTVEEAEKAYNDACWKAAFSDLVRMGCMKAVGVDKNGETIWRKVANPPDDWEPGAEQ
jgi:hypothetical protein